MTAQRYPEPPPAKRSRTGLVVGVIAALAALAIGAGVVVWLSPGEGPAGAAGSDEESDPPTDDEDAESAADEVTVTGVGDTIIGNHPDSLPPNDAADYFDGVAEELTGDVVFGNLEGPLSTRDDFKKCGEAEDEEPGDTGCIYIRMPPEYASVLADAGFTVMGGANNHAYDAGPDGHAETAQALQDADVEYTGVKGEVTEMDVNGVTVATVAVTTYDFYTNMLDVGAVSELVAAADEVADLVVLSMHAGAEGVDARHTPGGSEDYHGEDRGDPMAVSRAAVDAGADLVLGHGPHVLRGMEFYEGRLIAHSLGNFAGYGVLDSSGALGRGAILRVTLGADGEWVSGELVPTIMVDGGYPALDPDEGAYDDVNELAADFGDAGVSVDESGQLSQP